jgi:hypothetical protein
MLNKHIKTILFILFGLFSWLLSLWGKQHHDFVEQYYSRSFYQGIRFILDHTFGLLPFASFYFFWIGIIYYWFILIKKRPKIQGLGKAIAYWSLKIVSFVSIILGLFYWIWGFNYQRKSVAETLNLNPVPLDTAALWDELRIETKACDSLRFILMKNDTNALNDERFFLKNTEDSLRQAVQNWLSKHNYLAKSKVRGRILYPKGLLFGFGAAGLYWPFVGEGNIDAGLHPLQKLPTMAHEMSHGYGFGDEGTCNFIAYAACYQYSNPYIAYSNRLSYWRTVAANCRQSDPERYMKTFYPFIPAGIRQDVRAIHQQMDKYDEFFPKIRYQVYDSYLKSQGIEVGMLNYDEVMMLVRRLRLVENLRK